MATFQGKRVSKTWATVLQGAWDDGVRFQLNDGQRTIAMQEQRIRDHGLYHPTQNPTGAAPANPSAPHIKHGAENHALDVDSVGNGENELQTWLAQNGVAAVNNVSTERWHLDPTNAAQLKALARRIRLRKLRIRKQIKKVQRQIKKAQGRIKRLRGRLAKLRKK